MEHVKTKVERSQLRVSDQTNILSSTIRIPSLSSVKAMSIPDIFLHHARYSSSLHGRDINLSFKGTIFIYNIIIMQHVVTF